MTLEEYNGVCYGAATDIRLHSFLLPTLAVPPPEKGVFRDKFFNAELSAKLKVYTDLIRVCERHHIPKLIFCRSLYAICEASDSLPSILLSIISPTNNESFALILEKRNSAFLERLFVCLTRSDISS